MSAIIVTSLSFGLGVYYYITYDIDYYNMLTYSQSESTIANFVFKPSHQRTSELTCTYCGDFIKLGYYFHIYAPGLFYNGYTTVHRNCHNLVERKWFNQVMCIFKHIFKQSGWKVIYKHVLPYILFNIKSNQLR